MSSLWTQLKNKTRIGVQYLKEKAGVTQIEIDPAYQAAVERFLIMEERISQFFHDFQVLVSLLPKVTESGVDFSKSLLEATAKLEDEDLTLPRAFEQFFLTVDSLVKQEILPKCDEIVPAEVLWCKEKFEMLEKIKSERKQMQLLCDSTRDSLESLTKKGKPQEIAHLRIRYEERLRQLEEKTQLFVTEVDRVWDLRFTVMEVPLQKFIELVLSTSRKIFDHMKEMQTAIDPTLLDKDFQPAQ